MRGIVINFRRGRHTQNNKQLVILPLENTNPIGKKVIISMGKTKFIGKITRKFGKGKYLALFKRGLPGEVIGKEVEIL
jgi:ribosomal protein L35AE/L33A